MLSVQFLDTGKPIGTLTYDVEFDSDSDVVLGVLDEPVYLKHDGGTEDVYADDDPQLFMKLLYKHYKGIAFQAQPMEGELTLNESFFARCERDERGHCTSDGGSGIARTPKPQLSAKAKIAKKSHKLVDAEIQRYAEEYNEPRVAKAMGGVSFPDSEPVDVAIPGDSGRVAHGLELKTMVDNKASKITMKRSAMENKAAWERDNRADVHTLVLDDREVFNAKGEGVHDESKRVYYYRRGYGSFRVKNMHRVESLDEVKKLIAMKDSELPEAAQRPKGQKRGKLG